MVYNGRAILILIAILNIVICSFMIADLQFVHFIYFSGSLIVAWILGHRYDEVQYTSETDALTGVRNRWKAKHLFNKKKQKALRASEMLAAFIIDIDDFKAINDNHDHRTGDIVLQLISNLLADIFGSRQFIIRWGGDEFIVLHLSESDEQLDKTYRILQDEVKLLSDKMPFALSVSIGYSLYPRDGINFEQLIDVADKHMYSNKLTRV